MDSGFVIRVESLKDEAKRDEAEIEAYAAKIGRTLDLIEASFLPDGFDVGALSLVCAIDWIVFRDLVPDPLASRPSLAAWHEALRERPSLAETRPA
jgi:glutathione S-transferase